VRLEEVETVLADAADAGDPREEMSVKDMRVGLPVRLDERDVDGLEVVSWEVANPETGRAGHDPSQVARRRNGRTRRRGGEGALVPA
jgi:hypothetical protein